MCSSKGRQVVSFRAHTLFPRKTRNERWIEPSLDAKEKHLLPVPNIETCLIPQLSSHKTGHYTDSATVGP